METEVEQQNNIDESDNTLEEGITQLLDDIETEELEEKNNENHDTTEVSSDNLNDTNEDNQTPTGEKRSLEDDKNDASNKKHCGEDDNLSDDVINEDDVVQEEANQDNSETAAHPCEVSSTSLKTSNDSSTSTRTMQSDAEIEAQQNPAPDESSNNEENQNNDKSDKEQKDNDNNKVETSDESKDDEDLDETTSKLLASGISISLIRKKKQISPSESSKPATQASSPVKTTDSEPPKKSNPLEVGPHISVTMVSKSNNSDQDNAKFSLSLKPPSELLDPSKSGTKSPSNILNNDEKKDTISVSRIHKSGPSSSPMGSTNKMPLMQGMLMGHQMGYPMGPRPRAMFQGMGPGQNNPMSMPGLQPRPSGPMMRPSGPVSEQLTRMSSGLADYMRMGLEDVLRDLSAQGSPEATIKGLQLEIEKMKWRHSQEMSEMKQNVDMMMKNQMS